MLGCNLLRHIHSTTRLSCGAPTIEKRQIWRINNTHRLLQNHRKIKQKLQEHHKIFESTQFES